MIRIFSGGTFFSFRVLLSINAFYVDIANSVSKMPKTAISTATAAYAGRKTATMYQVIPLSADETLVKFGHIFAQFVHARDVDALLPDSIRQY